jgi:hypothetical protein
MTKFFVKPLRCEVDDAIERFVRTALTCAKQGKDMDDIKRQVDQRLEEFISITEICSGLGLTLDQYFLGTRPHGSKVFVGFTSEYPVGQRRNSKGEAVEQPLGGRRNSEGEKVKLAPAPTWDDPFSEEATKELS